MSTMLPVNVNVPVVTVTTGSTTETFDNYKDCLESGKATVRCPSPSASTVPVVRPSPLPDECA